MILKNLLDQVYTSISYEDEFKDPKCKFDSLKVPDRYKKAWIRCNFHPSPERSPQVIDEEIVIIASQILKGEHCEDLQPG